MQLIYLLLRDSFKSLLVSVVAGVIAGASATTLIALIHRALGGGRTGPGLLWLFAALCLVLPVSRFVAGDILIRLSQQTMYDLRERLCRKILAAPLRRLEELGAPRLLAALTDDVVTISHTLVNIPHLLINLAILLGCLGYLCWLSGYVLLLTLGFMLVGVVLYQLPVARATRAFKAARENEDLLLKHFQDLTEGAKELKLHRRRRAAFFGEGVLSVADEMRRQTVAGMNIHNAVLSWGQVPFFALVGALVFLFAGPLELGTETLMGCVLCLLYMLAPLSSVLDVVPILSRAGVALQKVEALGLSLAGGAGEKELGEGDAVEEGARVWGGLELSGVTHTYRHEAEDGEFTVGPIDLRVEPGELVFITGGNGSGKTTLAKLIVGLYIPEAGRVLFDGVEVTDENREEYRQNFSVVFNDFHLFERFIGLDAADADERARRYVAKLQLGHKVKIEGGRLSTIDLSQGQRKRLALLTAYLEDRPVYLFDEWAADQDPLFKEVFYQRLLAELKARGKTVLVITHDDRYFHVADRVVKLDYGQIVSDGLLPPASADAPPRLVSRPASAVAAPPAEP